MGYPLEGVKVLDFSRVLAGPYAGRMLADLGAEVVKVEPPDGDVTRQWGAEIGGIRGYFHQQNAGKRDVCIDLGVPGGAELARRLAAHADVAIENFRPGVAERLGIGYADLKAVNPKIILLSISGFGQVGPERKRAAYAPVIHAELGLIARQADVSDAKHADMAVSLADTNAGLHGLVALLAALHMRDRTGDGQHIDIAMIDATLATDDHLHYELEDSVDTRPMWSEVWDATGGPILITGDFRYIWTLLKDVCGVEDTSPPDAPVAEKIRLRREAAQAFFTSFPDKAGLVEVLDRMNLAWGDVRPTSALREQITIKARSSLTTVDDRAGGRRTIVQSPYRFSNAQSGVRGCAPRWRARV